MVSLVWMIFASERTVAAQSKLTEGKLLMDDNMVRINANKGNKAALTVSAQMLVTWKHKSALPSELRITVIGCIALRTTLDDAILARF